MNKLVPLFVGMAIALFSAECFAQEHRNRFSAGYEHTGAASPLTRSKAVNVDLELPFGNSRFSRIYSLSIGKDESSQPFYVRVPGGMVLSAVVVIIGMVGNSGTFLQPTDLKAITLIPDGVRFDLLREKKFRVGIFADPLTFDFRSGVWHYSPDAGLRSDFLLTERTFVSVKGAAKYFNTDNQVGPQIVVGAGRTF